MNLKQTIGWKFNPDVPYMTRQERTAFKELLRAGAVGFFRIGYCTKCKGEIPKSKTFCSAVCAGMVSEHEEDEHEEDDDGVLA